MRQRLDIADVEARTKIRAKYLRALENEEFGMLPGPTFVKTFLRTYAEALGIDPQVLVEEYRARYESREEADQLQQLGPTPVRRDRRRGGPPRGPGVAIALAALTVVAVLLVIGLLSDDSGDGDGEQASTEPTTTEPRERTERERPAPPRRVTLRIAPEAQTYVCIDTGPGTDIMFEDTIDAPRTFRGRRLRVNLGNTSVALEANGKPVEVSGPDPVGFVFTPGGMRPLPLGQRPCL
ncbi:MAG: cytoskeleton protein RodZ [Thermoleophilaceae bacterium]|jgi:hypothetical protein|nr:cytoskeleton protein RodZ [Thermoleophilaceae bacterium]